MVRALATLRALLCASVLGLLAGCRDAPTVPLALQQLAGGEEWVAMPAPAELPSLQTWLPYVERGTPEGRAADGRIRGLAAQAELARREGRLDDAALLDRESQRMAVLALARYPEPRVLQQALFAVDFWADRVQAEVALDRAPEMAQALREVRSAHGHAASLLAGGDTTSAVLHLSEASERIRAFTPTAVALRVLARVEEQLRARPEQDSAVRRALHLLASARQELLTGDPRRALRRALYALQLAHGNEVPSAPEETCLGPGCPG